MTAKLFLVTFMCICLLDITSTTLLQRAKRVCRRAAHNWRLIKSPSRRIVNMNIPIVKKRNIGTPKPYLKLRTKLFPVDVKYFEDLQGTICIDIDDNKITQSRSDKFSLLHRMDKVGDKVEDDYVIETVEDIETELTYDFDDFDDFLDVIDLFDIPSIDNLYCQQD